MTLHPSIVRLGQQELNEVLDGECLQHFSDSLHLCCREGGPAIETSNYPWSAGTPQRSTVRELR